MQNESAKLPDPISIKDSIEQFLSQIEAKVGISVIHLPSGLAFGVNETESFKMASTFKLPLVVYCLIQVDKGLISLQEEFEVQSFDTREGSGILRNNFDFPGVKLSLANLIRLVMEESDNTATDIVLNRCGGTKAVMNWLKEVGIEEISIQSTCLMSFASYYGVKNLPQDGRCGVEEFRALQESVSPEEKQSAVQAFSNSTTDVATPRAMVLLLRKLWEGKFLQPKSYDFLLRSMEKCATGLERIRKNLPKDTFVADKTGTMGDLVADVGIVKLPVNRGTLLLAIYVKGKKITYGQKEDLIATLSQLVYEVF